LIERSLRRTLVQHNNIEQMNGPNKHSAIINLGNGATAFVDGIPDKCNHDYTGDAVFQSASGKMIYWHTPYAHDINIKEQNNGVVYGWFNISKHNQYHDKEMWFNINGNTVHIWEKQYQKGKTIPRKIYNLKQLGEVLASLEYKEVAE
jgi:hypothetical protein